MKKPNWVSSVVLVVCLAASSLLPAGPRLNTESDGFRSERPNEGRRAIVVELFTSEGCSSCPPADRLLSELARTQPIDGAEILVLGQHVDYWNQLGWRDPFSSETFTKRQHAYARSYGNHRVYTPQMIVDGIDEFVGGDRSRALGAIRRAALDAKATVKLELSSTTSGAPKGSLQLRVEISDPPRPTTGEPAEVLLAITQNAVLTQVTDGENAGRKLRHDGVVRELWSIGRIVGPLRQPFEADPLIRLRPEWGAEPLRVVVFVQEQHSRRVLGAAAIDLPTGRQHGALD